MNGLQGNVAAAKMKHGYKAPGTMETVAASGDGPSLSIERFGATVGEAAAHIGQDSVGIFGNRASKLAKRLKSPPTNSPGGRFATWGKAMSV